MLDLAVIGYLQNYSISSVLDDPWDKSYSFMDHLDDLACCLGGAVTRDLHLTTVSITA